MTKRLSQRSINALLACEEFERSHRCVPTNTLHGMTVQHLMQRGYIALVWQGGVFGSGHCLSPMGRKALADHRAGRSKGGTILDEEASARAWAGASAAPTTRLSPPKPH